jgi:hypothetical protein
VWRAVRDQFVRLTRVLRRPPRDLLTIAHVGFVALRVEALIRWVSLPRQCAWLGVELDLTRTCADVERAPITSLPDTSQRQLRCAATVADAWPLGTGPCLRRSLVAGHLLRRRHRTALRIGVGGTGDDIHAHAWLEVDGRPIEAVGAFRAFQRAPIEIPR